MVGSTIKPFLDLDMETFHFELIHSSLQIGDHVSSQHEKELHEGKIVELGDVEEDGIRELQLEWLGRNNHSPFEKTAVFGPICFSGDCDFGEEVAKFKANLLKWQLEWPKPS